jgi:hypothetical protein
LVPVGVSFRVFVRSPDCGGIVRGVFVTIVAEGGGIAADATSSQDGAYRFDSLQDGSYRVDFELAGFDVVRRNHVLVRHGTTANVDATLPVSPVCECVTIVPGPAVRERAGQVVDESGRPIPHARLDVVSARGREFGYADRDGHFRVRLPVDESWPLTATCGGFDAVTQQLSAGVAAIVFKLSSTATQNVPVNERLARGCRCADDLFSHEGRRRDGDDARRRVR